MCGKDQIGQAWFEIPESRHHEVTNAKISIRPVGYLRCSRVSHCCRLGASPRDRPFIAGNVAAASTVAMLPAQFRYSRAHAPRSSFSGSPSDTGLSFGFGRDILSTEVVEHTKLMQALLKHESRTEAFERHNIVVKTRKMDGYVFTNSKRSNMANNKTATLAITSAMNNTINEWIMLFGGMEEDVHLFEGR